MKAIARLLPRKKLNAKPRPIRTAIIIVSDDAESNDLRTSCGICITLILYHYIPSSLYTNYKFLIFSIIPIGIK